ncbi:MAG TPA: phosphatidylinositol kinase, partial [Nocardioides sp.]|nr:phosphatidylinositol kinase [Nocardioides sp.]
VPVPEDDLEEVHRVGKELSGSLGDLLSLHLTDPEIDAAFARCRRLVDRAVMPAPRGSYPAIPWPPF